MWDERFRSEQYAYGKEPNDFLRENAGIIPKGEVLCLAEGEGRNAVFLAKQGCQVTAVDASIEGLKKAKKLADENNVSIECVHSKLENYEIEMNKWNGIISIFCHLPEDSRKELHKKAVKGLKKNGIFILEAYTSEQLKYGTGGPPTQELMLSAQALKKELEGLQFKHLQETERNIVEGIYHTGMAAVVQMIGVKV